MIATRDGDTVHMSADIASALTGNFKGYNVTLHAQPKYTFHVDADTVDTAKALAVTCARREGLKVPQTGATIQRV
jgi:hypothetical protein